MEKENSKENVRKLTRLGKYSLTITIPKNIVKDLGWREKQKLVVEKHGQGVLLKDWPKK